MATLEQFLLNGQMANVCPGASQAEVKALLGDPDDVSTSRNPTIWRYGALQLGFYWQPAKKTSSLAWIGVYFQNPERALPMRLPLTGWWPTATTTCDEFVQRLQGVVCQIKAQHAAAPCDSLELPSGVRVVFDEGRIHSLQYTARQDETKKQLSLSLPMEVWEQVRQTANTQQMSPAKLCSEWIVEKVQESTPDKKPA